jgi:ABC-type sugar transport system ATPase subunit
MKSLDDGLTAAVFVRGLSKSFPGVQALKDVNFELRCQEVHGLVGQNGAGKSTLVKILTGAYGADSGSVEIFGRAMADHDPRAQRRAGIAAIYQELTIVPEMSAVANVFLGRPQRRGMLISRRPMARRFRELAAQVGVAVEPNARAGALSVANQQMLEIMRALVADHRILIMDEPTASLGPSERKRLYETVRRLCESGTQVIYISHDLDEVLALCDRISVMRDGRLVATNTARAWAKDTLVDAMLGERVRTPATRRRKRHTEEILRVDGVSVPGLLEDVSLTLHAGEILGIAGLVGSGRTELLRALAGTQPGAGGRLTIAGAERPLPKSIRRALALGIALAPEDRKAEGLVLTLSGVANLTMTDMWAAARGPIVDHGRRKTMAEDIAGQLAFDARRLPSPVRTLSGGNQQKLVVGKWLHRKPRILLLDEPTRGIDVGAKAEMFSVMRKLSDAGMAIIMVSSELEEVVEIADRILVLAKGRRVAVLERPEISLERVLTLAFGVAEEAA